MSPAKWWPFFRLWYTNCCDWGETHELFCQHSSAWEQFAIWMDIYNMRWFHSNNSVWHLTTRVQPGTLNATIIIVENGPCNMIWAEANIVYLKSHDQSSSTQISPNLFCKSHFAVTLPCSVQNFKPIGQLRNKLWANVISSIADATIFSLIHLFQPWQWTMQSRYHIVCVRASFTKRD